MSQKTSASAAIMKNYLSVKIKVAFPFDVAVRKVIQVKTQDSKGLLSCCGFPQFPVNGWRHDELFSSGEQQGYCIGTGVPKIGT